MVWVMVIRMLMGDGEPLREMYLAGYYPSLEACRIDGWEQSAKQYGTLNDEFKRGGKIEWYCRKLDVECTTDPRCPRISHRKDLEPAGE